MAFYFKHDRGKEGERKRERKRERRMGWVEELHKRWYPWLETKTCMHKIVRRYREVIIVYNQ